MNILDSIINADNGAAVRRLGTLFGLDDTQTASALSALVPALSAGLRNNAQTQDGLSGLVAALSSGGHQRYIEDPSLLGNAGAISEGNGILGHVLGNKDISRAVAAQASSQTGVSSDVMKQMLPLVATLVMGAMARRGAETGMPAMAGNSSAGGLLEMLSGALDQNRDGSALDDIASMIGKRLGNS